MKDKLKRARIGAGLTQKELAEKIGASRSAVSAWERGDRNPSSEYVYMYQTILDLEKTYFCEILNNEFEMRRCFDISKLNYKGAKKLFEYYEMLLEDEEYLRK